MAVGKIITHDPQSGRACPGLVSEFDRSDPLAGYAIHLEPSAYPISNVIEKIDSCPAVVSAAM